MIVLGVDPGTAITGYGVIREDRGHLEAVEFGAIRTESKELPHDRLSTVFQTIDAVMDRHRPECLAVEQVFFSKNVRSALAVGQSRGVVLLAAAQRGMALREYTPLEIKMAVVGHGNASKAQVQAMIKALLGLDAPPHPDDVADALAIAVCCVHTSATKRRMGLE